MDNTRLLPNKSIYYNNTSQVNGIFTSYDNTLLSLATNSGFKLYRMDTFTQVSEDNDNEKIGPIKLAIPFYQSHLVFLVGKGNATLIKDCQLVIWNDLKKEREATLTFKEPIINAKINKEGIFLLFEKFIAIYDIITLAIVCSITNISTISNKDITIANNKTNDRLILLNTCLDNQSTLKVTKFKCENYQIKAKLEVCIKTPFKSIYRMTLNDKGSFAMIVGNPRNRVHIYSIDSLQMLYCFRLENPFTQIVTISIAKKNKFVSVYYADNYLEIYQLRENHKRKCKCLESALINRNSAWERIKDIFKAKHQYFARYKFDYSDLSDISLTNINASIIVKFLKMSEMVIIHPIGITEKIKFNTKEKEMIWSYKDIIWQNDANRISQEG